jgi:putative MATE family efflux protein
MGLQTVFNLVDSYLISRLEPSVAGPALGAIGICDQLAALGTIVSYGLSVATAAIVSRRFGENDERSLRSVAWQSLLVVVALAVCFAGLGAFGARWLIEDVVGAKGQVRALSVEYLRIMLCGSFSIFLLLHLTSLQRALGSSKTPVLLLVAANVANFVLAVVLIYGPGPSPAWCRWGAIVASWFGIPRMELVGGAWATVLARSAVLVPLFLILRRRFGLFARGSRGAPAPRVILNLWRVGWPSSAQLVVRILAMLAVHSLVARTYTTAEDQSASIALGIVFRLETMALFVGLGWGSAAQTFVGQNLGARNLPRAQNSGYCAAAYSAISMVLLALCYDVYGQAIVGFFDSTEAVVQIALGYLHWVAYTYVGLGVGIALGAAMQGAGATRRALLLDSIVVFGLELPAAAIVTLVLASTYERLWQVVALTYISFAVVAWVGYVRGRHLQTRLG